VKNKAEKGGPNEKKQPRRAVLVRTQPAGLQGDEYMKNKAEKGTGGEYMQPENMVNCTTR